MLLESPIPNQYCFFSGARFPFLTVRDRGTKIPIRFSPKNCFGSCRFSEHFDTPCFVQQRKPSFPDDVRLRCVVVRGSKNYGETDNNLGLFRLLAGKCVIMVAMLCGVFVFRCKRVFAEESVVNAGYGVMGQSILLLRNAWPKLSQVLRVFKEQGLVLTVLLGLSAFFSMAETSITTLWPWKVTTEFMIIHARILLSAYMHPLILG